MTERGLLVGDHVKSRLYDEISRIVQIHQGWQMVLLKKEDGSTIWCNPLILVRVPPLVALAMQA